MKVNIAVDNDEILFSLYEPLFRFHNEKYGTNLKKEDFISYHFHEVWGGDREEEERKVNEFFNSDYFANIKPVLGAVEAMKYLKERGHALFVVTGRIPSLAQKTESDLIKYFPGIFSGVCFGNSYGVTGAKIPKSTLCRKLNCGIIIEDDMLHIRECAAAGISVLAFDYPWNQEPLPDNATRVFSWNEIHTLINTFNKKYYLTAT
jgi:uncharacterized HAD superfamily protein